MKKDRCFLVVIFAVVCTVWSEVEAQDCNKTEELIKCLSPSEFGFSLSREQLDRLCPDLNRGLRCIDSYTRRCMTEDKRNHFHRLYSGTTQVIAKLCNPGPYQEEFLTHVPCMRQVSGDYEHCVRKYQHKIGEVHARMSEQERRPSNDTSSENDSELRTVCCSFRDYLDCSQRIVMEKCGQQTAKFTEDFLNQMSFSLIQAHCENYPQGSDVCQGSPAIQNSPHLLLPLAVFSVISRYVYRST